jgi:uncharacterized cupin superfamily protein
VSSHNPTTNTFEPFSEADVPWEGYEEGTKFGSRWKRMGKFGGGSHVGVSIEELSPGKQSSPFHYHMMEEEHLYALSGTATLRLGEKRYTLKPGDYCCFPAGQRAGHCLINEGSEVFRYIMIGESNPNEVCVYPDGQRVGIRSLSQGFELTATKDYWDGEKVDGEKVDVEKVDDKPRE